MKQNLMNNRGMSIVSSLVVASIIGVVTIALEKAYFSAGQIKSTAETKISFIDYENAAIEALGKKALASLRKCDYISLAQASVSLGKLGSVGFMDDSSKFQLSKSFSLNTTNPDDKTLNAALNSCSNINQKLPGVGPGILVGCLVFKDPKGGFSFMGMLGVFAKIRIELSQRDKGSNARILATPLDCNTFRNSASQEIRLIYELYFKKFAGSGSIFTKSGTRFVSQ